VFFNLTFPQKANEPAEKWSPSDGTIRTDFTAWEICEATAIRRNALDNQLGSCDNTLKVATLSRLPTLTSGGGVMKKVLYATLAVLSLAVLVAPVDAHGFGLRRSSSCGTSSGCADTCGMAVSYVDQEVTAYKTEIKTREVERDVQEWVTKEVKQEYKYYELKEVVTPRKQTVVWYESVTVRVPVEYDVCVPTLVTEKRKVTTYKTDYIQVPFDYVVAVPETVQEPRTVTTYKCISEPVTTMVPVCRTVSVPVCDPCTGCVHYVCQRVTEMQPCTRMVTRSVPETHQVMVNVCRYHNETKHGTRTECRVTPVTTDVDVQVCKTVIEHKKGERLECQLEKKSREETINVVTCERVEKTGSRMVTVGEWKTTKKKFTESYCVSTPYKTTVKVAVYTPVSTCGCAPVVQGCCK
jgi:hypothetical protein